jgi:hypothetical protein
MYWKYMFRKQEKNRLYWTIYPVLALIKKEKAGLSTDQPENALFYLNPR